MLALLFASTSTALRPTTIALDPCVGHETTASAFQDFAEKTWQPIRWQRKRPRPAVIRAFQLKLHCAAGTGHRQAIKRRWRSARLAFYKHRRHQLNLLERLRYLPFACGGGTRSAIPCSIMWCESGGSYTAQNRSSTARGKYQMRASTYAAWCVACDWSKADQDRAAHDLYAAAGGSPWVCA